MNEIVKIDAKEYGLSEIKGSEIAEKFRPIAEEMLLLRISLKG
jgi:hypothetical protein